LNRLSPSSSLQHKSRSVQDTFYTSSILEPQSTTQLCVVQIPDQQIPNQQMDTCAPLSLGEFPCKWSTCANSFNEEITLWKHLLRHIDHEEERECKWENCSRYFTHRYLILSLSSISGHVADHVNTHLSSSFCAFPCSGCLESFRNRQKLYRHKKTCAIFQANLNFISKDDLVLPRPEQNRAGFNLNRATGLM
jgi:hypothetical protein